MHPLVNASLGAIGNRGDVNGDWPAVHWLVTHWQSLFGAPGTDEQSLGDPSGLQWANYLYGLYMLAARRVGPGGNWADPKNLAAARAAIRGFAQTHPPSGSAPVGNCGVSITHAMAAKSFAMDAQPPFNAPSPESTAGGEFALEGTPKKSKKKKKKSNGGS